MGTRKLRHIGEAEIIRMNEQGIFTTEKLEISDQSSSGSKKRMFMHQGDAVCERTMGDVAFNLLRKVMCIDQKRPNPGCG